MQNWRNFNKTQMTRKAERKGGGGKFPPWEMELLVFEENETFFMRFLPPETSASYQRWYHWPAGGFPHTCTLEHPAFGEKCVFCHITPDDKDERAAFRARRTLRTVMDVIDFRYFHIIPHPEKDGKETLARCKHDDPEPKKNRCHLCSSDSERVSQRHGPSHKVIELTQDQWDQVWAVHGKLQGTCIHVDEENGTCDAKNYAVAYLCEHCEHVMIDEDEINRMPDKQMAMTLGEVQTCPKCSKTDYLYGVYACDNGGRSMIPSEAAEAAELSPEKRALFLPEDAEHWVVRGSMFDKVLEATITGKQKKIGKKDVVLKGFLFNDSPAWSTATEDLEQFGCNEEQVEKICTPWDLSERYRPEKGVKTEDYPDEASWVVGVLEAQAEAAGVPLPDGWGGTGGGGSPWGKKGGGMRSFRGA